MGLLSLDLLLNLLVYALIGTIGAFAKELYECSKSSKRAIKLCKISKINIALGGVFTGLIMPLVGRILLNKAYPELILSLCFVVGVLSKELFSGISTLANLKQSYKELKEVQSMITTLKTHQSTDDVAEEDKK